MMHFVAEVIVFILILSILLHCCIIKTLVSGGNPSFPGEFPWITIIQIKFGSNYINCGGTIIDRDLVLTAAHCLKNEDTGNVAKPEDILVAAGVYNTSSITGTEQFLNAQDIRIHSEFNRNNGLNDIALIKLSKATNLTKFVGTLRLPSEDFLATETIQVVAGWGATKFTNSSNVLMKAKVSIVADAKECPIKDHSLQICAGGNRIDTCTGDSGGPLMCIDYKNSAIICGIVSYGFEDHCGDKPGVYTNVYGYRKWIAENRGFESRFSMFLICFVVSIVTCGLIAILGIVIAIVYFKRIN